MASALPFRGNGPRTQLLLRRVKVYNYASLVLVDEVVRPVNLRFRRIVSLGEGGSAGLPCIQRGQTSIEFLLSDLTRHSAIAPQEVLWLLHCLLSGW